mgnify:CR=1 FL=1
MCFLPHISLFEVKDIFPSLEVSLEYIKVNNKETFSRVYNNVINHFGEIENLINSIPFSYMDTQIISSIRKEYYLKTLMIRLNYILKEYIK